MSYDKSYCRNYCLAVPGRGLSIVSFEKIMLNENCFSVRKNSIFKEKLKKDIKLEKEYKKQASCNSKTSAYNFVH